MTFANNFKHIKVGMDKIIVVLKIGGRLIQVFPVKYILGNNELLLIQKQKTKRIKNKSIRKSKFSSCVINCKIVGSEYM